MRKKVYKGNIAHDFEKSLIIHLFQKMSNCKQSLFEFYLIFYWLFFVKTTPDANSCMYSLSLSLAMNSFSKQNKRTSKVLKAKPSTITLTLFATSKHKIIKKKQNSFSKMRKCK